MYKKLVVTIFLVLLFVVISIPTIKAVNYTNSNLVVPPDSMVYGPAYNFSSSYSSSLIHSIILQADISSFNKFDHIKMHVSLLKYGSLGVHTSVGTTFITIYQNNSGASYRYGSFANGKYLYKYETRTGAGGYGTFNGTANLFAV